MKKFSLLFVIFFISCGGGGGDDDSSSALFLDACSSINARVIGGETCGGSASPVVKLNIVDVFGERVLCTGTAIASNAVLTAAHCFIDGALVTTVETSFGSFAASDVIVHPEFDLQSGAIFNDVAIVTTAASLNLDFSPILVSRQPLVGEEGVVAGFGQTESGSSGELKAGNTLVSQVTDNHIFTEFNGTGANPCLGDSGGPLLLNLGSDLVISGVVSTGNAAVEDCGPGDTTLYASVLNSSVQSFIFSTVPEVLTR